MQGLGGTGAQQSKDCSFGAGTISGAPLRISWFLVIFFVYNVIEGLKQQGVPPLVNFASIAGRQALLLLTVLCHEMGHGTMARVKGGDIMQVLLWPFGGICFTTRAQGRLPREKLVDDLWIVAAGPATHFPQTAVWMIFLSILLWVCSESVILPSAWSSLVPFSGFHPCVNPERKGCFDSWGTYLVHDLCTQAVQLNVMLFIFNVFFPMYPMDGAKLIVCSLQLFCNVSARCAARVLIYTSTPLAIFFIYHSLTNRGGLQSGIMTFMGFMCLVESYKIWKLMKEERLYTHPLFELARSSTREVHDSMGASVRLNQSERDDEERAMRAPQVQITEVRLFSGEGRVLSTGATVEANADSSNRKSEKP